MSFMHKVMLFLSGFIFRTTLFFGLTLLAAVIVLTDSNTPKQALIEADAYNRYTESVISAGAKQAENDPNAIPLNDPIIAGYVKQALNEKSLRELSEGFIDAGYGWLEGETNSIEYRYDVSQNKEILAKNVSNYAIERLVLLDTCTEVPEQTNVFKINCFPFNTDITSIRMEIYNAVRNDKSLYASDVITSDDLPRSASGLQFEQAYSSVPKYYQWLRLAPWLLFIFVLIGGAGVLMLSRTKRRGVQVMATSVIGTGVILAVAPILYTYILPSLGFGLPGMGSQDETVAAISNDAMRYLYNNFNAMLINIAFQTFLVGTIVYVIARYFLQPKSRYAGIKRKAGIALTTDINASSTASRPLLKDIPVQSSEKSLKRKRHTSNVEKKIRKMYD